MDRYRLVEWLTFITTEVHKNFGVFFIPGYPEDALRLTRETIAERLRFVEGQLMERTYLQGERFSVADAYLFTVLSWTEKHGVDLQPYPNLRAYRSRVGDRLAVLAALRHEGLLDRQAA